MTVLTKPTWPEIELRYRRLLVDNHSCTRCTDSEKAAYEAYRLLALELAGRSINLILRIEDLDPSQLADSNTLVINGWPVEHWLGASSLVTDCPSCADLIGNAHACCRALCLDGSVHESLTPDLIMQAIRRSM